MDVYLLHVLNGRLRIKVPEMKGLPLQAASVMGVLHKLRGVTYVHANPTTGSVLVLFESEMIRPEQIVQTLQETRCLSTAGPAAVQERTQGGIGQRLAETVVHSVFEAAIQRAILALI
jgi:copper chaperone CopZ